MDATDCSLTRRAEQPFPARWCLLGTATLFITVAIGRPAILAISGMARWMLAMELFVSLVVWGVLAGIVLIFQAIAYRLLHARIHYKPFWMVLSLLPAIMLGANSLYQALLRGGALRHALMPTVRAQRILEYGRLASLPESATDIMVHDWSSPFSGEWYLCFCASPEDIERFLAESPSLQGQSCETFSRDRMRLPISLRADEHGISAVDAHMYFIPGSRAPEWFNTEIRERGRRYAIPPKDYDNWGEVIVNDAEHVVYVKVIWS